MAPNRRKGCTRGMKKIKNGKHRLFLKYCEEDDRPLWIKQRYEAECFQKLRERTWQAHGQAVTFDPEKREYSFKSCRDRESVEEACCV